MSAVMYAAREGHADVVKQLGQLKVNLDKQEVKGQTALMLAVQKGHFRVVQALIEAGADIQKQSIDGSKAVDFAVVLGFTRIEELLSTQATPDSIEATPTSSHTTHSSSHTMPSSVPTPPKLDATMNGILPHAEVGNQSTSLESSFSSRPATSAMMSNGEPPNQ